MLGFPAKVDVVIGSWQQDAQHDLAARVWYGAPMSGSVNNA